MARGVVLMLQAMRTGLESWDMMFTYNPKNVATSQRPLSVFQDQPTTVVECSRAVSTHICHLAQTPPPGLSPRQ